MASAGNTHLWCSIQKPVGDITVALPSILYRQFCLGHCSLDQKPTKKTDRKSFMFNHILISEGFSLGSACVRLGKITDVAGQRKHVISANIYPTEGYSAFLLMGHVHHGTHDPLLRFFFYCDVQDDKSCGHTFHSGLVQQILIAVMIMVKWHALFFSVCLSSHYLINTSWAVISHLAP